MTFIITLNVREGIVMAGDSRLTFSATTDDARESTTRQLAITQSDSSFKLFLTPNNIGISTCGIADINGVLIAEYIKSFISEKLSEKDEIDVIPKKLLDYFRALSEPFSTFFYVAGYKTEEGKRQQHVWSVDISTGAIVRMNSHTQNGIYTQGAYWNGATDIITRLVQNVGQLNDQGNITQKLPHFQIQWELFSLQDAIDFAVYAVRTTMDSIYFQTRPKTVGGAIDVLVIKPNESYWIQQKKVHV